MFRFIHVDGVTMSPLHQPRKSRRILTYAAELLLELVMIIMEFADYKPRLSLESRMILSILLNAKRWISTWNIAGRLFCGVI